MEVSKGKSSSGTKSSGARWSSSANKPVDMDTVCRFIHNAIQTWADVMILRQEKLDSLFSKIYTVETGFAAEVTNN